MNKHRNHTLNVEALHAKRKNRTNTTLKGHMADHRAIAEKSNVLNRLTVVDNKGNTVVQTNDKGMKGKKTENAFELGKKIAETLKSKKISTVIFDRNGYRFTGRIKALCDGLREGGITI
jgi:large subunit ribosomal protein L18